MIAIPTEEQREATRATLARRGQSLLAVCAIVLPPVLVLEKTLGLSNEAVLTLRAIFGLLVALEFMAFGHYFVRRSAR